MENEYAGETTDAADYSRYGIQQGAQLGGVSRFANSTKAQSLQAHQRRRALSMVLNASDRGVSLDEIQAAVDLVRAHIGE